MHTVRPTTAHRVRALVQRLSALLACVCLAGVSLAAASGGAPGDPGAAVVAVARAHLGDTYVWGDAGPKSWDCSGLTSTLWREVGGVKDIPRVSRDQQAWAVPIPAEQALPGDLVFFGNPVTHVGIVKGHRGTTVLMVDASSSQQGVVERAVWTNGTVRFGRVPRRGMVAVRPWTPPVVVAPPAPVAAPEPITPTANGVKALTGLPSAQGSLRAVKAAGLARSYLGNTTLTDVALIRNLWHRAGGPVLPGDRDALAAGAKPVALADARVGDLVLYGPPASHVGIYVGNGLMVDGSRSLGKVVLRRVWASTSVHLARLAG